MNCIYIILSSAIIILAWIHTIKYGMKRMEQKFTEFKRYFVRLAKMIFFVGKMLKRITKKLDLIGATVGVPKLLKSECSYFVAKGTINSFGFQQSIWCGGHAKRSMEEHLASTHKEEMFFVGGIVNLKGHSCKEIYDNLPENCRFASIVETLAIAKNLRFRGEDRIILCAGWDWTDHRTRPESTYYTHRIAVVGNKIVSLKITSYCFFVEENYNSPWVDFKEEILVAIVRK